MDLALDTTLTDEDLLKRLAEIEERGADEITLLIWNPLLYWSDCGPLIEKYQLDIEWAEINWHVMKWPDTDYYVKDPDLKRCICMAIVEAHK